MSSDAQPPPPRQRRIPAWTGLAVALVTFLSIAPALRWLEFSNGIEELYAATVMELGRGGPWLVPELFGAPRIAKPPLPAWVGGLTLSDGTMREIASSDPVVRAAGYAQLAWDVRWPALAAGCVMLLATFDLGRTLGGRRVALAAVLTAATSLLFFRFARLATSDIYLAGFVAVANALLARAVFRRQLWLGCVGFGTAIGLAFMCKGPVGLIQSLLPFGAWWGLVAWGREEQESSRTIAYQRTRGRHGHEYMPMPPRSRLPLALAIVGGLLAFLAIALPWPLTVLSQVEGAKALWWREITREGATDHEPGPIWSYLTILVNILPWLPLFLVGFVATCRRWRGHRGHLLAALLLVVPIVVMTFARDKPERYLLPMLPATAILCGRGWVVLLAGVRRGRTNAAARWMYVQFGVVVAAWVGLPLFGATNLIADGPGGSPWFKPSTATIFAGIAIGLSGVLLVLVKRGWLSSGLTLAAAGLLGLNLLHLSAYSDSAGSKAETRPIAERILTHKPDAVVAYIDPEKPMPPDLAIYLNRIIERVKPRKAGEALATQPAAGGPAINVIVMLQRENEEPPTMPGWRTFATEPHRKRFWHAMERE